MDTRLRQDEALSRSRRDGTLPTFFIIGAPKAGTTSLHHYLEQHAQIQMSSVKEPGYFAPALNPINAKRAITSRDRYEKLFDPEFAVRGEASTNYAEYPFRQGVPERIKALVPEAKFIYLVRDPVDRTVSHYHHLVAIGGERRSLESICGDLSDPRSPCICASLYALQFELYLRLFSEQSILVVDQVELLTDRRATLCRIFNFLSVDATFDSERFDVEFLKGEEHRAYPPGLANFVGRSIRPRSHWIPPRVRRFLRTSGERLFLPPLQTAAIDAALRSRLQAFYAEEIERLRSLTGIAFPAWSV